MATDFTKAINASGSIKPTTANTPLDVRTRIESISEVENIPLPFTGMIFYVIDEDKYYSVKTLKGQTIAGTTKPNMLIDTYSELTTGSSSGSTSADVPVATTSTAGKVKPDGTTITVTSDGTISATATTPDLSDYQTKTDSSLTTTAKTIVGAINEVKQTASTGVDAETITAAVDAYMEANPVSADVVNSSVYYDSLNPDSIIVKNFDITQSSTEIAYDIFKLDSKVSRDTTHTIRVTATITSIGSDIEFRFIGGGYYTDVLRVNTSMSTSIDATFESSKSTGNYFETIGIKGVNGRKISGSYKNLKIYIDGKLVGYTINDLSSTDIVISSEDNNSYLATSKYVDDNDTKLLNKMNDIPLESFAKNIRAKSIKFIQETPYTIGLRGTFSGTVVLKCFAEVGSDVECRIGVEIGGVTEEFRVLRGLSTDIEVTFPSVSNVSTISMPNAWSGSKAGLTIKDLKVYVDGVPITYDANPIEDYVEVSEICDYPATINDVIESSNKLKKESVVYSKVIHFFNNTDRTVDGILNLDKSKQMIAGDTATFDAYISVVSMPTTTSFNLNDTVGTKVISLGDIRNVIKKDDITIYNSLHRAHSEWTRPTGKESTALTIDISLAPGTDFYLYDPIINIGGEVINIIGTSTPDNIEITENLESIATKEYVEKAVGRFIKTDKTLPFVNNIYTVGTDKTELQFAVPIFLDYLYGGYKKVTENNRIYFAKYRTYNYSKGLNDRMYVYNGRNSGKKIYNTKTTVPLYSDEYNVAPLNFNNINIDMDLPNGKIHILTIGDSVTAGAITKKQYWSFAAEYFAKEDLYQNRTSDVLFLGTNNFRSTEVTANNRTRTVNAAACGISSWSLNKWLTQITDVNPFTYTDSNGNIQFSIAKFVERYRNYTDDGVKLELGDPNLGTNITSDNIDRVVCCTPTHLYINSTHNGGTIEEYMQIINIAKQEFPGIKIIVGDPMPLLGTWFLDYYEDRGWIINKNDDGPNYSAQGGYMSSRIAHLKHWVSVENNRDIEDFYIMPQNVITPTIEGYEYTEVDVGFAKLKKITEQPMSKEHPGTDTHKIWGYELYALLKFIQNENDSSVTTNVVSVSLSESTASLTVGNTTTLTATPGDGSSAVTFSSSDESVATVDTSGVVTAVATGECYIYAETTTSIFPANCKITVTE